MQVASRLECIHPSRQSGSYALAPSWPATLGGRPAAIGDHRGPYHCLNWDITDSSESMHALLFLWTDKAVWMHDRRIPRSSRHARLAKKAAYHGEQFRDGCLHMHQLMNTRQACESRNGEAETGIELCVRRTKARPPLPHFYHTCFPPPLGNEQSHISGLIHNSQCQNK